MKQSLFLCHYVQFNQIYGIYIVKKACSVFKKMKKYNVEFKKSIACSEEYTLFEN